jgi:hypothetical protein
VALAERGGERGAQRRGGDGGAEERGLGAAVRGVKKGGEADTWVPPVGSWDEGELRGKMNAEEVYMKERIWMTRTEYSVLKKVLK